jgi:preprotein translocase subunit SecE
MFEVTEESNKIFWPEHAVLLHTTLCICLIMISSERSNVFFLFFFVTGTVYDVTKHQLQTYTHPQQ